MRKVQRVSALQQVIREAREANARTDTVPRGKRPTRRSVAWRADAKRSCERQRRHAEPDEESRADVLSRPDMPSRVAQAGITSTKQGHEQRLRAADGATIDTNPFHDIRERFTVSFSGVYADLLVAAHD